MHNKFDALWIGPYIIEKCMGYNSYILKGMDDQLLRFPINGGHIKHFFA